ncbi:MAG TPA: SurA N-terminal domain-containing protein [Candidatus Ratteibacteria bacterium]|jgi:flagellar biosynthesis chaperone FliJ|uniref:Chaperone SurA n=1 Tax=candidate division TA06 bacterium ADurb.Bin131 TaxID=1852827 RepID=A0A1V6C996_UNCT6|nr:MAG: Chaperone SurA [candidate division TA06 bacterium ADurb.Bin131]HOC02421.1 SurA N-terminal domain-containing protein [bacterium]HRS05677.1 SurA N-terminal domain-containing protein [Candidatus Ratteibacteria bacterium]HON04922.1 SurA N-terminal domain-containing protein [bacterium]HOQ81504.1 SurA N-terminal domain-containing protein [bacterium]
MRKLFILILTILFTSLFTSTLYGIEDRCVATVGTRIIWDNDVKERASVRNVSYESALFGIIAENLFAIQAKKENIPVSREEVDNRLNLIINGYASREKFFEFLAENGVSIDQYREIIADQIRADKLISQKISSKISISLIEISKKISKMSEEKEVVLLSKSFNDISEVESFISNLRENQNQAVSEMVSTGWIDSSRIDPFIMQKLKDAGKGKPVIIRTSEKIILYILVAERDNSPEEKYMRARKEIFDEKYNALLSDYVDELRKTIPVKIFDKSIEEQLFHK